MVLVDTSVWVDHLRHRGPDGQLAALLEHGAALGHPSVTGELALGHLRGRAEILGLLGQLPQATVATPAELLAFIERHELLGLGIGYVDAQLLAATKLTDGVQLWTHDRRLIAAAEQLSLAYTD